MSVVYIESSAALAFVLRESRATEVAAVLNKMLQVTTSALTLIEVRRGIYRHKQQTRQSEADYLRQIGFFEELSQSWSILEITPSVQARAGEPFPVEPVRSLDAIHLASILECVSFFPELHILSFDQRILDNCVPLGLSQAVL